MKSIVDTFGRNAIVDDENRKLYSYNNKKKEIVYSAEVIEDGKRSGSWTNYIEKGTVDDIEERLKMWNNKLLLIYANMVNFNRNKNDADGEIYKRFVDDIRENEDKFFTKTGDFRKKFIVTEEEIVKMVERVERK